MIRVSGNASCSRGCPISSRGPEEYKNAARPELVEGPSLFSTPNESGASTSSARTGEGWALDSQTSLCEPSQFHSSSGQIATGSPALFISPKPCPPRSKKCASTGAPMPRSEEHTSELQSIFQIGSAHV